jgi:hypothetical protein
MWGFEGKAREALETMSNPRGHNHALSVMIGISPIGQSLLRIFIMSQNPSRAIISPSLDPWLVGGFSILVLVGFLVLSSAIPQELILGNFLVLTVLLNGTHFMASYSLLYSSREYVYRYRTAAIFLPIGLLAIGALGLCSAAPPHGDATIMQGILVITALYLALHYTGQAWGMMASYAYVHGIRFLPSERRTFRICLRTMALWQMVWALTTSPSYIPHVLRPYATPCMHLLHIAAVASLLIGTATLMGLRRRLQTSLPSTMVLAFGSLYVWYAFLFVYPQSLFWVQIFHSLQYLAFPFRIEMNRFSKREALTTSSERWRHLFNYSVALTFASLLVFVGIDKALNYPNGGYENYFLVIVSLINIHHYFIDGCIWHISNPEVRADLFAHITPPSADGQTS